MAHFHINGKVMRIASDPGGHMNIGDIFVVKAMSFCHEPNIDIGIKTPNSLPSWCDTCGHVFEGSSAWYCSTINFIPIDDEVKQRPKIETAPLVTHK